MQAWHKGLLEAANKRESKATRSTGGALTPRSSTPLAPRGADSAPVAAKVGAQPSGTAATNTDGATEEDPQRAMDDIAREVFSRGDSQHAGVRNGVSDNSEPLPRMGYSISFSTGGRWPGHSTGDNDTFVSANLKELNIVPPHRRNPSTTPAPTPTLGPGSPADAERNLAAQQAEQAAERHARGGGLRSIPGRIVDRVMHCGPDGPRRSSASIGSTEQHASSAEPLSGAPRVSSACGFCYARTAQSRARIQATIHANDHSVGFAGHSPGHSKTGAAPKSAESTGSTRQSATPRGRAYIPGNASRTSLSISPRKTASVAGESSVGAASETGESQPRRRRHKTGRALKKMFRRRTSPEPNIS
jgi:hypothetical protein